MGEVKTRDGLQRMLEPYPGQYRTGRSWLPSLGQTAERTLRDGGIDPRSVPHPIHEGSTARRAATATWQTPTWISARLKGS